MKNMFKYVIVFMALIGISLTGCDNGNGAESFSTVQMKFTDDEFICEYEYNDGYYLNSSNMSGTFWTLDDDTVTYSELTFQVKLNGSVPASRDALFGTWEKTGSGALEISNAREDGADAWWFNGLYSH